MRRLGHYKIETDEKEKNQHISGMDNTTLVRAARDINPSRPCKRWKDS